PFADRGGRALPRQIVVHGPDDVVGIRRPCDLGNGLWDVDQRLQRVTKHRAAVGGVFRRVNARRDATIRHHGYVVIRSSFARFPPRTASLSALLRNLLLTMGSTLTGQLNGVSVP